MTWSPLACGLITGKYSDGVPECSRAAMKVSLIYPALLRGLSHFKRPWCNCPAPISETQQCVSPFSPFEGVPVAEGTGEQRGGPQAAHQDQRTPSTGRQAELHRCTVSHR